MMFNSKLALLLFCMVGMGMCRHFSLFEEQEEELVPIRWHGGEDGGWERADPEETQVEAVGEPAEAEVEEKAEDAEKPEEPAKPADQPGTNGGDAQPGNAQPGTGDGKGDAKKECKAFAKCVKDTDCGESGKCTGIDVGKCDCLTSACFNKVKCDAGKLLKKPACGGLKGACNTTSNECECDKGYTNAGFKDTADALANFCGKKECDGTSTDACFGYPCKTGLCTCGIKPAKPAEKPAKPGEKPADKPAEKPTL